MVTGDVLLHPPLWEQARSDGSDSEPDFTPLLSALRPYLSDADLAICSLETPVGTKQGPYSGYPSFVVPPQILPALAATGYDACTTATNHAVDGGTAGVKRTLDGLDRAGLEHTGTYRSAAEAKEPLILESGGIRVGIVAATYGLNGLSADTNWRVDLIDTDRMIAQAQKARQAGADVVLAGFHAGEGTRLSGIVEQKRRSGGRVVLSSYLLAPGFFQDQASRLIADSRDVLAPPLLHDGVEVPSLLVDVVRDRVASAL